MKVEIVAMPDNGVVIDDIGSGFAAVTLYKKIQEETKEDGSSSVTADQVTIKLRGADRDEIISNFDYYWEKAEKMEQEEKLQGLDAYYKTLFDNLDDQIVKASALGDDDLKSELITERKALVSEYTEKRGEI